jgi:bacterioferritin
VRRRYRLRRACILDVEDRLAHGNGCGDCLAPRLGKVAHHRSEGERAMKGHTEIIDLLNELLTNELSAINQYFIHAKLCEHWGYKKLAHKVRAESIVEMKHADQSDRADPFSSRGIQPAAAGAGAAVGETVPSSSRPTWRRAHRRSRSTSGIATCRAGRQRHRGPADQDPGRRGRAHTDWLETQVETIETDRVANYLSQQQL